jgi:uncharacterized protein YraI
MKPNFFSMIFLAFAANRATAAADGPDFYRVTRVRPNDVLNIRAAPTANAAKLGSIPRGGRCIRNQGCQGGLSLQEFSTVSQAELAQRLKQNPRWCRDEYQGITGWVAGRYPAEGSCR